MGWRWAFLLPAPVALVTLLAGLRVVPRALVNTSFQFGGALVLAIVTAVADARSGTAASPASVLSGYHAAIYVVIAVAALGAAAMLQRSRRAPVEVPVLEAEALEEAA